MGLRKRRSFTQIEVPRISKENAIQEDPEGWAEHA